MCAYASRDGNDPLGIKTFIFLGRALDESLGAFIADEVLACGERHFDDVLGCCGSDESLGSYRPHINIIFRPGRQEEV